MEINGYEIEFKIIDGGFSKWYCAYVTLKGKLKDNYSYETFREKNKIGVDTVHSFNMNTTLEQKKEDAINQITHVINEHIKFHGESKCY